ncbi:MAG: septum formation protein Maf [Abditibacteriota bacterium]|nr:septum formation protein Maf [Abditibacteriota bacterium]
MKYVLCSASPRRRELLKLLAPEFDILVSQGEETCPAGLAPCDQAVFLARQKLPGLSAPDTVYIAADTIVTIDGLIMGKPADRKDAEAMLQRLSGRKHEVITGFALLLNGSITSGYEATDVYFSPLTREEISLYASTDEPMDKAGAYAIQGLASRFIEKIEGDYFNVVGLPVSRLYRELSALKQEESC